jgi:hypothetical protein
MNLPQDFKELIALFRRKCKNKGLIDIKSLE